MSQQNKEHQPAAIFVVVLVIVVVIVIFFTDGDTGSEHGLSDVDKMFTLLLEDDNLGAVCSKVRWAVATAAGARPAAATTRAHQ